MNQHRPGRLRIHLLGTPTWHTDGASGTLQGRFALLVAYVAASGRVTRDRAAQLLWDNKDLELARDSLRQLVLRLRKATGHAVLHQAEVVELAAGVECDVQQGLAGLPLSELVARGEFLAGAEVTELKSMTAWIHQQRRHWYSLVCDSLVSRHDEFESHGHLRQALRFAEHVTEQAPALESGWRARMWLHFLSGDTGAAAAAHSQLVLHLAQSGALPSLETQRLWRTAQRAAGAPRRLHDHQPGLSRPPILIGRDRQLAIMSSAWELQRPLLVRGEGGIGKSRLVDDFVRQFGPAVIVSGLMGDQDAPYATLGSLVRALVDQQGIELEAKVRKPMASVLRELDRPADRMRADKLAIWRAAERVLEQAAESGVRSIAVDNLHHVDLASLETLRRLSSGPASRWMRFAFASRPWAPGELHEMIEAWRAEPQPLQVIDLLPLTGKEVGDLLATLDLEGEPARIAAEDLFSHAGGNPLFLLETLREVSRSEPQELGAALPRPSAAIPLLERQVRAISSPTLELLNAAAVLDSSITLAAKALDRPAQELESGIVELQSRGVLRDGGVMHDLMRETVLSSLTAAQQLHLNAVAAAFLAPDRRIPRARVAAHWEKAGRWPEAASTFREAGLDAHHAGRLAESRVLFERAASCFDRANDRDGQFEALYDSFDGELDLGGPDSAQRLVDRLRKLMSSAEQAARAQICEARVAVGQQRHDGSALVVSTLARELAAPFEHLHSSALSVQAVGYAHAGHLQEAIDTGRKALSLSLDRGPASQTREITSNLVYAYFQAHRIKEAFEVARPLVEEFEAAGDLASTASMLGNLAALELLAGDPLAASVSAGRAHRYHREVEELAIGPLAVNNRTTLGSAYTYLGRFSDALEALWDAGPALLQRAPPLLRSKLQVALAHFWLLLGRDDDALAAIGPPDDALPAPMRVHRCWVLARVSLIRDEPAEKQRQLRSIGDIVDAMGEVPFVHTPWPEWSRQGDPAFVASRMLEVRTICEQAGRPGAARTAQLRCIDRLQEIDSSEAVERAATMALELCPRVQDGLLATVYLPEAWCILSSALERAGETAAAAQCREEGRNWVKRVALPNVKSEWRDSFLYRNPVNRVLLGAR